MFFSRVYLMTMTNTPFWRSDGCEGTWVQVKHALRALNRIPGISLYTRFATRAL